MTKRLISLLLALVMVFAMAISASAAEIDVKDTTLATEALQNTSDEIVPYVNPIYSGTVAPGGNITLYPTLASYVGFSRNFTLTSSSSGTGTLYFELYDPNGKLISDDWIMAVNKSHIESFFLPSSGRYTLKVYSWGTTENATVNCFWEG